MTEKFPWFAARLLFDACVEGEHLDEALYEERIILVHAESGIGAASKKAEKLGKAATDHYKNASGDAVSWRFREVLDVVQLNETTLGEGSEVYHQFLDATGLERVRESLRTSA